MLHWSCSKSPQAGVRHWRGSPCWWRGGEKETKERHVQIWRICFLQVLDTLQTFKRSFNFRWEGPDQTEKEDGASESHNSKNPQSQEEIRDAGLRPGDVRWVLVFFFISLSLQLRASSWPSAGLQTSNLRRLSDSSRRSSPVVPQSQRRMKSSFREILQTTSSTSSRRSGLRSECRQNEADLHFYL